MSLKAAAPCGEWRKWLHFHTWNCSRGMLDLCWGFFSSQLEACQLAMFTRTELANIKVSQHFLAGLFTIFLPWNLGKQWKKKILQEIFQTPPRKLRGSYATGHSGKRTKSYQGQKLTHKSFCWSVCTFFPLMFVWIFSVPKMEEGGGGELISELIVSFYLSFSFSAASFLLSLVSASSREILGEKRKSGERLCKHFPSCVTSFLLSFTPFTGKKSLLSRGENVFIELRIFKGKKFFFSFWSSSNISSLSGELTFSVQISRHNLL